MNTREIKKALEKLNEKLKEKGILGEVGLYGGAVMCMALDARESTKDIDDIFYPKADIYKAIKIVAEELGIEEDWLNDAVKGFMSDNNEKLTNLNIYVASPQYMFAMKALSCRMDNKNELNDIKFLIDYLGITSIEQAEDIIYEFYPRKRLLPKTFYMLMEILEG